MSNLRKITISIATALAVVSFFAATFYFFTDEYERAAIGVFAFAGFAYTVYLGLFDQPKKEEDDEPERV